MLRNLNPKIMIGTSLLCCWILSSVSPADAQVDDRDDSNRRDAIVSQLRQQSNPATIPSELIDLVLRLDSPNWVDREQASDTIRSGLYHMDQFRAMLRTDVLSQEQRNRLLMEARHRIVHAPRGAVGIRMSSQLNRMDRDGNPSPYGSIEVIELLPDLPAREVLLKGDQIHKVDGQRMQRRDDFSRFVQRKLPGEIVTMDLYRVRRDNLGKVVHDARGRAVIDDIHVEFPLGSRDKILDPLTGLPQQSNFEEADRNRARAMVIEHMSPSVNLMLLDPMTEARVRDGKPFPIQMIDEHQRIRDLKIWKSDVVTQGLEVPEQAWARWEMDLRTLQLAAERESIPEIQRTYHRQVAQRFAQLIEEIRAMDDA